MIQLLAYRNLKFNTTICIGNILRTADHNIIGYYVEVSFKYHPDLHDKFQALNPKVYSHNHQSIQDRHEKQMKDKLVDIQVERPQFYKVISKIGNDTEEHQLIWKNTITLKGVSKSVVKMRSHIKITRRSMKQISLKKNCDKNQELQPQCSHI